MPSKRPELLINFDIELNENRVYLAGTVVEGNLVLKASKVETISYIDISFSAAAQTHWSVMNGDCRVYFSDREIIFNTDEVPVLHVLTDSQTVMAGVYKFPFQFQLPVGCLSSWQSSTGYGSIGNWLTVTAATGAPIFVKYTGWSREIIVAEKVDINLPQLIAPLSNSNEKTVCCGWCASGPISLTVTTDRGGYFIGETIGISVDAKNNSSRRVTVVRASLKQKATLYAIEKRRYAPKHVQKIEENIIQRIEGQGIEPGGTCTWINEPLHIPATTTPTINNCRIIKLSYSLVVTLALNYATDLHVTIPIRIGSVPYDPLDI